MFSFFNYSFNYPWKRVNIKKEKRNPANTFPEKGIKHLSIFFRNDHRIYVVYGEEYNVCLNSFNNFLDCGAPRYAVERPDKEASDGEN